MHSSIPRVATIRDVARLAEVSVTTVSHALSDKRPVRPETVLRIQAAIEALGYVPSSAARTLQAGRTFMLGLVVPDVSDPFFGRLAVAVERAADENDYGVVLSSSGGAPMRESRYVSMLRSRSIDGLVYVAGRSARDPGLADLARSYPVVLADEWTDDLAGIPYVGVDNVRGGELAAQHLAALGHSHVAVLTGPRGLRSAEERLAGFVSVFPDAAVIDADFSEEVAYHRTARLIAGGRAPTAIFASNDVMALGVLDAVRDSGASVPDDISLVGFDDIPLARRVSPALTTVHQPVELIGALAAEAVIAMSAGREALESPRLPVELIVRDTTAPPRTLDRKARP
jgi:LacI family transcriptional regulator